MKSETLADRLLGARTAAKLTMTALERAADVAGGTVSWLESGRRENPTLGTIRALAKALGCSPTWLAYGDVEPEPGAEGKSAIEQG